MKIRQTMLEVDYTDNASAAQDRHRKERLITIFRQLAEELEARIAMGIRGQGHWLVMLRGPAGDSLPYPQFQPVHDFGMRVLRRPQDQLVVLQNIDECRVALDLADDQSDDALEDPM